MGVEDIGAEKESWYKYRIDKIDGMLIILRNNETLKNHVLAMGKYMPKAEAQALK